MRLCTLFPFARIFVLPLALAGALRAADFNWSGASLLPGGNDNMSNPLNWSNAQAPPSNNGTADLIFSGIARTSPNADIDYTINTIRFTSISGFTLGGNDITLQTDASVAPFIRNEASVLNRINNNLTFANSGTIFAQNGNLTLGGVLGTGLAPGNTVTLTANSDRTLIVNSSVGGFGSLSKTGGGTVRFNALVANTGTIAISAGTMELSGQISSPPGPGPSAFNFTGGTVRLLDNNRIPTLPIDMPSGGTLDFNGFSDEIGALSGSGAITLGDGGVLIVNQATDTNFGGAIVGTGTAGFTKRGAGVLTLTQINSSGYSGPTLIEAGALRAGATNTFAPSSIFTVQEGASLRLNSFNQTIAGLAGAGTVNLNAGNLTINQATNTEFSGVINGTLNSNVIKSGTGRLRLSAANTYSGHTTIQNGTLAITRADALGTDQSGTTVNSGGTLEIVTTLTLPPGETLSLAGSGINSSGALSVRADSTNVTATIQGDVQLTSAARMVLLGGANQASLDIFTGSISSPGTMNIGSHQLTFAGNSIGTAAIRHKITGTGDIVNESGATLILSADNSGFSGGVNMLGGSLQIDAASAISATGGAITIGTAAPRLIVNTTVHTNRTLELGRELTSLKPTAAWNGSGTITIHSFPEIRAIRVPDPPNTLPSHLTLNGTGPITGNAKLVVSASADCSVTIGRPIQIGGGFGLEKSGQGIFYFNGPATIAGITDVKQGIVEMGIANGLSATSELAISSGAEVKLNGLHQSIGGLAGAGQLQPTGATVTIRPNRDVTHSGFFFGAGSVIIEGDGVVTQTFSGTKNYSGTTTIRNGGRLRILGDAAHPPQTQLHVNANGRFLVEGELITVRSLDGQGTVELLPWSGGNSILVVGDFTNTTPSSWSGTTTGPGGLIKSSNALFTATNATFNHTGLTRIGGGTFRFGADTTVATSPFQIDSTARLHATGTITAADVRGAINPGIADTAGGPS